MKNKKEKLTKTTVMLPVDLLNDAQEVTGEGITKTLRLALELLAARKAYDSLLKLKGSHKFSVDLKALRDDSK